MNRERESTMDNDNELPGVFVSGGYRPKPPVPPLLPPISEVMHGTLYQADDGSLWRAHTRATNPAEFFERAEWVRVEIVTAEHHRRTQQTAWAWLANLALPFVVFACWMGGLFATPGPTYTLLMLGVLIVYALVAFTVYVRTAYRLKRQLVAPNTAETP